MKYLNIYICILFFILILSMHIFLFEFHLIFLHEK